MKISVQFVQFRQGLMETAPDGAPVFIGRLDGMFGVPPDGTRFEAEVKLAVGASFDENAYEVIVPREMARLGALPDFRQAAMAYLHGAMTMMLGPNWARVRGLTAQNNLIAVPGPLVELDLPDDQPGW